MNERDIIMQRLTLATITLITLIGIPCAAQSPKQTSEVHAGGGSVVLDPAHDLETWEGWGSSLSWWARAIGGTQNADYYADLIYTTKEMNGLPGLGLNIIRYNVGGGGVNQPRENKGPKLQWQMDIDGYWTESNARDPVTWNWSADENQRLMMQKAKNRGANVFEMFSDSPMWWMNINHSTAGSDSGDDCLDPKNYDRFALYLASVARHAADRWGIKFTSVEPFNEPSASWWKFPNRQEGCHFDLATQQVVVQRLRRALDDARLQHVAIAAADENNMDAGLKTWNSYDSATRARVGKVNVHGYSNGTDPYQGPNRVELRRAIGSKRKWLSEYGDEDASGYAMAVEIVRDLKEFRPNAWVYWQPVEPDVDAFGWGLINSNYVDTHDRQSNQKTTLLRVNRKFFAFGQFTRYIRERYHLISIDDPNSIAAYDASSHKLVIVKVTGAAGEEISFDLSRFSAVGDATEVIATTTAPDGNVPDWKQHHETGSIQKRSGQKLIEYTLHPKSVYSFVVEGVWR